MSRAKIIGLVFIGLVLLCAAMLGVGAIGVEKVEQLTFNGTDGQADWSPDGSRIVFVSGEDVG